MHFEDHISFILSNNKNAFDNRILKLEYPFPPEYLTKHSYFLETFFINDPFEIKPEDLETILTQSGKIKKLKEDRKPSTYLSIFRFLELYRQLFKSQQDDLGYLATIYKSFELGKFPANEILKEKVLKLLQSSNRIYTKWQPQTEELYKSLISQINKNFLESENLNGKEKAFVNLRKMLGENFLITTFHPHFESLVSFCIMCIAHTSKLRSETKLVLEEVGQFKLNP